MIMMMKAFASRKIDTGVWILLLAVGRTWCPIDRSMMKLLVAKKG